MKTHNNLYEYFYSLSNLILAWRNARKGKTKRLNIIEFEKDLLKNLFMLHYELKNKTYKPKPLINFILRDPKTRKISKSAFRDRVVHHALINVIGLIFEKQFIFDSCANQIGKGTSFALKRLDYYKRKVTKNNKIPCYILKADIKHYFEEVYHEILIEIIQRKITDEKVIWLIKQILANLPKGQIGGGRTGFCQRGMPLGNLTSQFFANVYLNELDYFVKHKLKVKYYIRYVDDFVILHESKEQLAVWKEQINEFLMNKLRLQLHSQKSRIIPLSRGVDFVGFRNFYHFKLLRKRNIKNMRRKVNFFREGIIDFYTLFESYHGWQAHASWANTYKLREQIKKEIISIIWDKINL